MFVNEYNRENVIEECRKENAKFLTRVAAVGVFLIGSFLISCPKASRTGQVLFIEGNEATVELIQPNTSRRGGFTDQQIITAPVSTPEILTPGKYYDFDIKSEGITNPKVVNFFWVRFSVYFLTSFLIAAIIFATAVITALLLWNA